MDAGCVMSALVFDWLEIMYDVVIGYSKKSRAFAESEKLGSCILS